MPLALLALLAGAHAEQALLGATVCGGEEPASSAAIIGTFDDAGTPRSFVYCSGTLIAPDVVVVAAHCITETTALEMHVSFQRDLAFLATADEPTRQATIDASVAVRQAVADPDYDGGTHDYDVGLFLLDTPVLDVEPAIVIASDEEPQLVPGLPVAMVGYGYDESQVFGVERCAPSTLDTVDVLKLFTTGSPQGCNGDSGSGLFLDVDTPHARADRIAGVASYTNGNCADFTGYTRLGGVRSFLDGVMQAGCDTRAWCDVAGVLPPDLYDPPPPPDGGEGEGEGNAPPHDGAPACGADGAAAPPACALGIALLVLGLRRRARGGGLRRSAVAVAVALTLGAIGARATSVVVLPLPELAAKADVVVRAVVVETHVEGAGARAATYTTLAVVDAAKGAHKGERVVVYQPGGTVDGVARWIAGAHRFRVGEEVALVGQRRTLAGRSVVVGMSIGVGTFVFHDGGLVEDSGDVVDALTGAPPVPRAFSSWSAFTQALR